MWLIEPHWKYETGKYETEKYETEKYEPTLLAHFLQGRHSFPGRHYLYDKSNSQFWEECSAVNNSHDQMAIQTLLWDLAVHKELLYYNT